MKIIKQAVIFTIVSFALIAGVSLVYAWTGPTQSPPAGNVDAPVNVGNSTQYKSGAFGVGGLFRGYGSAVFDGNVGIGMTNPTQKLDVLGYVKGTGLCIGNDCKTSWPTSGGAGSSYWSPSGNDIYNTNYGNVGIGMTNPGQKLEVAGNIKANGLFFGKNSERGSLPGFIIANNGVTTGVATDNFNIINNYSGGYANVWANDYYIGVIGKWASQLGGGGGGGGGQVSLGQNGCHWMEESTHSGWAGRICPIGEYMAGASSYIMPTQVDDERISIYCCKP